MDCIDGSPAGIGLLGRSPSAASSLASEPMIRAVRFGGPGGGSDDEEALLAAQREEEIAALAAADAALLLAVAAEGGAAAGDVCTSPPVKCSGGLHLGCLPVDLVGCMQAGGN
jgi:hypothetical protein